METMLEACMIGCLCVAVAILLHRFMTHKSPCALWERCCVITIGIGFVIGAISKILCDSLPWTFVLYVVGAVLCYTAALFSFPEKQTAAAEVEGDNHE